MGPQPSLLTSNNPEVIIELQQPKLKTLLDRGHEGIEVKLEDVVPEIFDGIPFNVLVIGAFVLYSLVWFFILKCCNLSKKDLLETSKNMPNQNDQTRTAYNEHSQQQSKRTRRGFKSSSPSRQQTRNCPQTFTSNQYNGQYQNSNFENDQFPNDFTSTGQYQISTNLIRTTGLSPRIHNQDSNCLTPRQQYQNLTNIPPKRQTQSKVSSRKQYHNMSSSPREQRYCQDKPCIVIRGHCQQCCDLTPSRLCYRHQNQIMDPIMLQYQSHNRCERECKVKQQASPKLLQLPKTSPRALHNTSPRQKSPTVIYRKTRSGSVYNCYTQD